MLAPPARPLPPVSDELLAALSPMERFHYRMARRMNTGAAKRYMSLWMYTLGSIFIRSVTARRTAVFGMDVIHEAPRERPLLLVANHRSYFDMFVVASEVYRHTGVRRNLYFPIMGNPYYAKPFGMIANATVGFWSMFPPLFAAASHKDIDRHSLETLVALLSEGHRTLVGIHPEGGRNRDPDPYTLRRVQPGTGRIIHTARPFVIPTFVVGLENTLWDQVAANWRNPLPIRIHFGAPVDVAPFLDLPAKGSTYKLITDHVMDRVRELMEVDRGLFAPAAPPLTASPNP
ncbi:MAG: lysophospholipid acyltransferase family protein [Gemmatimonadaceae bacterium]